MAYSQFGYTYPPTSSQIIMTGQHPSSATTCCQSSNPADPIGNGSSIRQNSPAVCPLPTAATPAYDTHLLSSPFSRLSSLYGSTYGEQGYVAALAASSNPAFYATLPSPYDLKESRGTWGPLPQPSAATCYTYDPIAAYGPYGERYSSMDSIARRKNATRETTNTLKAWLYEHRKNPYPTKGEKIMLAIITKMTLTQVSTWFANARRRLKKENKMTWEPRNKSSDSGDIDDKADTVSCPSSCDNTDKKSNENSLDSYKEDDAQSTYVKAECISTAEESQIDQKLDFCSIKSESSEILSNDCLSFGHSSFDEAKKISCSPKIISKHCGSPVNSITQNSVNHRRFEENCHQLQATLLCSLPQHSSHQDHHEMQYSLFPHRRRGGDLPVVDSLLTDEDRPKIWSLAHTATSDSPPSLRPAEIGGSCQMLPTNFSSPAERHPVNPSRHLPTPRWELSTPSAIDPRRAGNPMLTAAGNGKDVIDDSLGNYCCRLTNSAEAYGNSERITRNCSRRPADRADENPVELSPPTNCSTALQSVSFDVCLPVSSNAENYSCRQFVISKSDAVATSDSESARESYDAEYARPVPPQGRAQSMFTIAETGAPIEERIVPLPAFDYREINTDHIVKKNVEGAKKEDSLFSQKMVSYSPKKKIEVTTTT